MENFVKEEKEKWIDDILDFSKNQIEKTKIEKTKEDANDKVLERKEEISESAKPLDEKK